MTTRKRNKPVKANGKSRRMKQRVTEIVSAARRRAFKDVVRLAAKENPNGVGYIRWFVEAWQNVPIGRRGARS